MNILIGSQVIIILLSLYFIVRTLRKMPKKISYVMYGFLVTATITIFFMSFYYPETLTEWVDTLKGWQQNAGQK